MYDAVVLGAGPGGYAAAIRLGQRKKKVAIIEKDKIGGECLNYGCIPSKAIIELANSINYLKEMPGVSINYNVDMKKWQEWKWSMINKLTGGVELLLKAYGVDIFRGTGYIQDKNHVKVNDKVLETDSLVIATGSKPVSINGINDVMYNREVLDLDHIPSSIVIIGGGYIGVEIGIALAKLGSKVTIVEMMPSILPGTDNELVRHVVRRMSQLGINVITGRKVLSTAKNGEVTVKLDDGQELRAEKVLMTVGRIPNTEGFGLENLKLAMDGRFIKTDSRKMTSVKGVYAIGDVSGQPMLAHKAYYEADIAADNICGIDSEVDYRAMPYVIYSDPEIAYTGVKGAKSTRFPVAANGRSLTMNENIGTFNIYYDEKGIVTGAGIAAPHASELISEISLAVESGLMAMDIGLTIHPHPTVSEGVKESAEEVYGKPLHFKL
ncbi:pyruvate dehydrogenase E3 / dihydrolipoamide dehydrogenase [Thermoplasma volcanium GSS1]|uniref:Dihydrolipoyl dehydrogenase n=1 Tax=Thermoplasma volcanium (strain ATCC 51530 / DSM 4299 / JCM 9571 / NBRC 15438 / GSS1) TaxID=273116 RepID=Q97CK3_THEVO|nr:dihydrolipoyl dehydrogenase [Thermoplasma volcanium]BAB59240.1 pyruvate dehydrogenase E3 / dihydrolipoamide dehydrogenase [Thermoplasma volcanium GSS1]